MRFFFAILVALFAGGSCLAAVPAELHLMPVAPSPADRLMLRVLNPNAGIEVDTALNHTVELDGSTINVTTRSSPPGGDIRLPAFRDLDVMIPLGKFNRGTYDLRYEYYGEAGNLFVAASARFTVVPEASAIAMAWSGVLLLFSCRRLTRRCS
jgi:hypothetical protein